MRQCTSVTDRRTDGLASWHKREMYILHLALKTTDIKRRAVPLRQLSFLLMCERQVKAVDADSGINAEIAYSIDPGSNSTPSNDVDSRRFVVDSSSGDVRLTAALTSSDVNTSYHVTVRATDAGTQPLSTVVRLCLTVVDRSASGDRLRSVALLAAASLRFDGVTVVVATLLGGASLCVVVVVVVVVVVTRRRARARRRRQQRNRCKNLVQFKSVDARNGAAHVGDGTATRRPPYDDDDDDDDVRRVPPRTLIRTLDRSPRSLRGGGGGADTRNTRWSRGVTWQNNSSSSSALKRHEPDGCFDVPPPPSHTGAC